MRSAAETLFYLEMRSPGDLEPTRLPLRHTLSLVEATDHAAVRDITLAIGKPYDWPSQHWNEQQWAGYFATQGLRNWIAEVDGDTIGLASLRFEASEVELDTFGLVPAWTGSGLGAALLGSVVNLAWREAPQTRRLWLHTSSRDHSAALPNYLRRGFSLYRTVER